MGKDSLWSVDLFRCESIRLKTHWVLVVIGPVHSADHRFRHQGRRRRRQSPLLHVQPRHFSARCPKYLSADNDPLFSYHQWQANLRILEVEEIKTVPYAPLSHPFVERLIGTIRREFLDHVLFWNATDLQRKLDNFRDYYNTERVHDSCDIQPPVASPGKPISLTDFHWRRCCRGLYELPIAA